MTTKTFNLANYLYKRGYANKKCKVTTKTPAGILALEYFNLLGMQNDQDALFEFLKRRQEFREIDANFWKHKNDKNNNNKIF